MDSFLLSVSVYDAEPNAERRASRMSSAELLDHVRYRFEQLFPGVRSEVADPAGAGAAPHPGNVASLACRVWHDGTVSPSVFQVGCRVSTAVQADILQDRSFGYASPEKAPDVVRQQLDHILQGFAVAYSQAQAAR